MKKMAKEIIVILVLLIGVAVLLAPALVSAEEAAAPAAAAPALAPKIDTGDTAWMIVATAMVPVRPAHASSWSRTLAGK